MSDTITVHLGSADEDFAMAGAHLSAVLGSGGDDTSPAIRWTVPPSVTPQSFAVTVFDPDAPTGSGFWHWGIYNIPAEVRELAHDAGRPGSGAKPAESQEVANDAGFRGYVGAAPPPGHGPHRYYFRVHALDVAELSLPEGASPAILGFNLWQHEIARGEAMVRYEASA